MSGRHDPPLIEADRLVHDGGRYTDDITTAGHLHAAFVRSDVPHGMIQKVDSSRALAMEGVEGVYVQTDLDRMGARPIRVGWIVPGQRQAEYDLLARQRVRFVGEAVAVVLARDRYLAEDAARAVVVRTQRLPAVVDLDHALATDAPLLYPEWGENVLARWIYRSGDADARFQNAAVRVSAAFDIGRAVPSPMEPRGGHVRPEPGSGGLEVTASLQSCHHVQYQLAEALDCEPDAIRVIAPDVGGSFGLKDHLSPELGVVAVLARATGSGITWIEDRRENLVAAPHGRGQRYHVELAADEDGHMLAVRGTLLFDAGAQSGAHGIGTALYSGSMLPGPYDIADFSLEVVGVVTNKVPCAAYRGYGGPESTFAIEGLVDRLARSLGIDRAELRRRNFIPRDRFPYTNPAGLIYDQADHARVFEHALDAGGYRSFRRGEGATRRGIGIACVIQRGGFGPSQEAVESGMAYGGYETARVRMDTAGHATVLTGMSSQGQGTNTALAQVCADRLGIAFADVTVICGDTALTPFSPVGAIASRGAAVGGSAVHEAAGRLAEKLRQVAAVLLEASPLDIRLSNGRAFVEGTAEPSVPIARAAAALQRGEFATQGIEPGLEVVATFDPPGETTSYGTHVATVSVDERTGQVRVERYVCITDCGRRINPGIVEGQVVGAIVQGIGGALYEEVRYAADGTPLVTSLLDYSLPTAADVPLIEAHFIETPTPVTLTGARGVGEIGINGPAAAIASAVADALGPSATFPWHIPMLPDHVWSLSRSDNSEGG